ncbi:MAG: hypothetical protein H6760_05140 [Candidatus Nomurabacteria bacterium]|nr:MAG: hypothetical protein H6760_05140 [Candidatus Nomurabacteria bacterium]
MKKLLISLSAIALLASPAVIPKVDVADNGSVEISQSGDAQAWNLVLIMCKELHVDEMCDLYDHGVDEGWWN